MAWDDPGGTPRIISFDILEEETPKLSSIVTKYPIEKGSDITDHSQPENPKLEVTGSFVDFPLTSTGGGAVAQKNEYTPVGAESRAMELFNVMDQLRLDAKLVRYRSIRLQWDDCLISSLTYTQDKMSGNAIKFRMVLEQQTFAESKRAKTKRPKNAAGQQCVKQGDKASDTPETKTKEKTKSFLFSGASSVISVFK